jgi:hypothetical protein
MRNGVQATMTKGERDALIQLIKQRERVEKAAAEARSKDLLADLEHQLGTIFKYDRDEVWAEAKRAFDEALEEANVKIAKRNAELGIPREFAPSIELGYGGGWQGRNENGCAARRAEFRRMGVTKIIEIEANAKAHIAAKSVELQTEIISHGLTSDAAVKFLEKLPSVTELMKPIPLVEIEKWFLEDRRAHR